MSHSGSPLHPATAKRWAATPHRGPATLLEERPTMQFTHDDIRDVLRDMVLAENLHIPGEAKQAWVIAEQIRQHGHSPSPVWIWLLIEVLQVLIPKLLAWLKKKYGEDWPGKITDAIQERTLPWQS